MRRARAKQGQKQRHDEVLLFETLEERVLLNATPFSAHALVTQPQPVLHEADGAQLFVSLSGPGQVQAVQGAGGPELIVTGTNANSNLTLTVQGGTGHFTLNELDVTGSLGSLNGAAVNLQGALTAGGAVQSISLGDLHNSTFTAGGPVSSINLGTVEDSTISVSGAINSLTVNSWIAAGGSNHLNATSIAALNSGGDFDASLALSGPTGGHEAPTLGLANIGGAIADGYWYIVGDSGLVTAGQVAANWTGDFTKSVSFSASRDFDGTLATADLKFFSVGGNLNHAQLMIGADLGASGHLGDSSNHFGTGTLETLLVRGSFISSRIWVGVVPGPNGVYDAGGDSFFGNPATDKVQFFSVGGSLDSTSKVEAGAFALPVFVNGKMLSPATTDPHFVTHTQGVASLHLSLAQSNAGPGGLTNNPTVIATYTDNGAAVSLVATLDGRSANSVNLQTQPQANNTVTITSALFQTLAGGTLKDGAHTLTVVATDKAGNVSTQTLSLVLDTTPPAITATLANDTGVSATDRITSDDTVSGKVNDATASIVSFKAGLDGTAAANGTSVLSTLNANPLAGKAPDNTRATSCRPPSTAETHAKV